MYTEEKCRIVDLRVKAKSGPVNKRFLFKSLSLFVAFSFLVCLVSQVSSSRSTCVWHLECHQLKSHLFSSTEVLLEHCSAA